MSVGTCSLCEGNRLLYRGPCDEHRFVLGEDVSIDGRGRYTVVGFEIDGEAVKLDDGKERFTVYAHRVRRILPTLLLMLGLGCSPDDTSDDSSSSTESTTAGDGAAFIDCDAPFGTGGADIDIDIECTTEGSTNG